MISRLKSSKEWIQMLANSEKTKAIAKTLTIVIKWHYSSGDVAL
jgi:hypothetical protein